MAGVVYALCALTALGCAVMLLLGYRKTGNRLLLWSGLCFSCLTVNNVLVFVDLLVVPDIDLYTWRNGTGLLGMALLLFGLIWEVD
ncbi:MAG: hypothetical protein CVV27_06655 [Candidatus Melainabacteria bacterium HGW-Melainabacteria-1]|nr:MAG: hypothetical protein CVV27_06655 [Candidatus Melainabacteria bacterium HGW-Melainabacteria-1]